MKTNNKIILLLIIFSDLTGFGNLSGLASAQEWIVPPDQVKVLSPFPFKDETRKAGEGIYMTNCKSCHGDPGKGNSLALNPPPPDPGGEKMQKNSDGDLLYKIREGHGAMPSFKNVLPVSSIWNVISFFRSFNKQYTQQVSPKVGSAGQTKISLNWLKDKKQIITVVTNEYNKMIKPVSGEEIQLFIVRYFGNLAVDRIKVTDSEGKAAFVFPDDVPGDSLGKIRLLVRLADETKYGEIKADTMMKIGAPIWRPPLNEERAIWKIVQKTPLWLLISYVVIVLTIWGFIFYVLYLLRVIYVIGKG